MLYKLKNVILNGGIRPIYYENIIKLFDNYKIVSGGATLSILTNISEDKIIILVGDIHGKSCKVCNETECFDIYCICEKIRLFTAERIDMYLENFYQTPEKYIESDELYTGNKRCNKIDTKLDHYNRHLPTMLGMIHKYSKKYNNPDETNIYVHNIDLRNPNKLLMYIYQDRVKILNRISKIKKIYMDNGIFNSELYMELLYYFFSIRDELEEQISESKIIKQISNINDGEIKDYCNKIYNFILDKLNLYISYINRSKPLYEYHKKHKIMPPNIHDKYDKMIEYLDKIGSMIEYVSYYEYFIELYAFTRMQRVFSEIHQQKIVIVYSGVNHSEIIKFLLLHSKKYKIEYNYIANSTDYDKHGVCFNLKDKKDKLYDDTDEYINRFIRQVLLL